MTLIDSKSQFHENMHYLTKKGIFCIYIVNNIILFPPLNKNVTFCVHSCEFIFHNELLSELCRKMSEL